MEHHHRYYYRNNPIETLIKKRILKCWSALLWPLGKL
ncbi:MAG: hypothetical protein K0R76_521 [Alphaproteobacteria bacterium]|jgi:hypothetical protein|nr:hypothetical protein [Alphaproteobacteria bacterium]MDF3033567.1 hypothetical protein [Alphaproteobacteria bacterium]